MPNQIIPNREQYDATVALNYSGMKELLKTPASYRHYLTATREETKALRMGRLTHAFVLEPEVVTSRFVTIPGDAPKKPTKAQIEAKNPSNETCLAIGWWKVFNSNAEGKTIVDSDEWEVCVNVAQSMSATIKHLGLTIKQTEVMLLVDYCGCPLKVAIDAVAENALGDEYIIDLKSTEDASPKAWLSSARSYRYPLQGHTYRTAFEAFFKRRIKGVVFVAGEKSAPYLSAAYEFGPELMTYAIEDFEKAVALYKSCSALDEWPGYPTEVTTLDISSKSSASAPITFA